MGKKKKKKEPEDVKLEIIKEVSRIPVEAHKGTVVLKHKNETSKKRKKDALKEQVKNGDWDGIE